MKGLGQECGFLAWISLPIPCLCVRAQFCSY